MKSLITFIISFLALPVLLLSQCIDEKWHNTSFESIWLSCNSRPNPLPELGNSHWILYQFEQPTGIEVSTFGI